MIFSLKISKVKNRGFLICLKQWSEGEDCEIDRNIDGEREQRIAVIGVLAGKAFQLWKEARGENATPTPD